MKPKSPFFRVSQCRSALYLRNDRISSGTAVRFEKCRGHASGKEWGLPPAGSGVNPGGVRGTSFPAAEAFVALPSQLKAVFWTNYQKIPT